MNQQTLFVESLEEALKDAVQALGGPKAVGLMLWPQKSMKDAGDQLNHCLDERRAEKLELSQVMLILRKARAVGCHTVMAYLAKELAYDCEPVSRDDQIERLRADTAKVTEQLSAQLRQLQEHTQRIAELTSPNLRRVA